MTPAAQSEILLRVFEAGGFDDFGDVERPRDPSGGFLSNKDRRFRLAREALDRDVLERAESLLGERWRSTAASTLLGSLERASAALPWLTREARTARCRTRTARAIDRAYRKRRLLRMLGRKGPQQ